MFSVVELMLISGQKVELCAGDQITIGGVGEDYKGRWCCLSKTSNSSDIRRFLIGAPDEALVSVGRNRVSFKRSDIFSIKDIEQSDSN